MGTDRFGRTVGQTWANDSGTILDQHLYEYDAASNRVSRDNTHTTGLDEIYTYDGLNRLVGTQRGTLASGVLTNETAEQSWTLSATGNWEQFTHDTDGDGTNETDETRTYNNANEITDISTATAIDPAYDAAGNMTRLPSPADNTAGQLAVYDAWGLCLPKSPSGLI